MIVANSFGTWLKARRKELGLTQKDLAQRVGCSAVMVEKIESGERRPSEQIAELLADLLNVPDGERRAFVSFARGGLRTGAASGTDSEHAPWRALRRPFNLPAQHTPFVGREEVVAEVSKLMRRPGVRLLTLSGPPGIGKTRLSLEVAAELHDDFPDGVYFVPLAPVRDPGLVIPTIAQVLGLRETGTRTMDETLKGFLRDRQLLLVLDNFEQVTEAAVALSELLSAAPQLKALVSSRALLNLYGEYDFAVPPMEVPNADQHVSSSPGPASTRYSVAGTLGRYEAVRLFIERARYARRDFNPVGDDMVAAAEICTRLDGLPLAIELAAARVRNFSPVEILEKLENRLALLVGGPVDLPPRQRTLRGAIDWSYDLLDEEERRLFERLSVFVGGCTPEGVQAVEGGPRTKDQGPRTKDQGRAYLERDIRAYAQSLVDKSLLSLEPGAKQDGEAGETRYRMLETIREYASERLEASGEVKVVKRRHLEYYLALALTAHSRLLKGPDQATWLRKLELEHDNLRAALRWALDEGEGEVALQMSGALWKFWLTHGHLSEGRRWLDLALLRPVGGPTPARALALNGAGNLAHLCGDFEQAEAFYEEALSVRRALGDKQGIASTLNNLAIAATGRSDYTRVMALHQESLALKRELGDQWGIASSLGNLGISVYEQGDYVWSRALHEESLAIRRELGDRLGIALALSNLGNVALAQGEHAEASALHEESLAIRRQMEDRPGIAESLMNLGNVARSLDDFGRAAALHQESLDICRELGDKSGTATSLYYLGYETYRLGEPERAAALLRESLNISNEVRDKVGIAKCLAGLAGVAGSLGQGRRAATLFGAMEALLEDTGFQLQPVDRAVYERDAPYVREMLGESAWTAAWELGRAMTLERAVAFALEG